MMANISMDEIINSEMLAKELKIATTNLNKVTKELNEAEFKCHKLRQFRQDYVDRYNEEMKQYVSEDAQRGFKSFFSRLDVVIYEQQETVENLRRQFMIQRQLWKECKTKEMPEELFAEDAEKFALVA